MERRKSEGRAKKLHPTPIKTETQLNKKDLQI
jgi:hypothetical protein